MGLSECIRQKGWESLSRHTSCPSLDHNTSLDLCRLTILLLHVHIHSNNLNMHWGAQQAEGYLSSPHICVKYYITGCRSNNTRMHWGCLRNMNFISWQQGWTWIPSRFKYSSQKLFSALISPSQKNIISPEMKDAGWRACVVLLWIIHGNVTSQPPWRMSFCILCSNRIMWTWTRSGCGSEPSVTAWATRTLTSVHLSYVMHFNTSYSLPDISESSCFALLTHLASVCYSPNGLQV